MKTQLHVLFVGTKNIARSILGEVILKDRIIKAAVTKQFTCSSCGTDALSQEPCPKELQVFAKKQGLDLSSMRSQIITKQMVESSDILLCMDSSSYTYLTKKYHLKRGKIFLLRKFDVEGEVKYEDLTKLINPRDAAMILEVFGEVRREVDRIFKKLVEISYKKVQLAQKFNKKQVEG